MLQERTILTLVDKEARLLTFQPIDVELQAILHCHIVIGMANDEAIFLMQIFLQRQRGLALTKWCVKQLVIASPTGDELEIKCSNLAVVVELLRKMSM